MKRVRWRSALPSAPRPAVEVARRPLAATCALVISAASVGSLAATAAHAQGIGYTITPAASSIRWNEDIGLENSYLYGGKFSFDFERYISLQGYYMTNSGVRSAADRFDLPADVEEELAAQRTDLRHYGANVVVRLGTGTIVPFLQAGGGILEAQPDAGQDRSRQITLNAGGGLSFRFLGAASLDIWAEDLAVRFDRNQLFPLTGTPIPADPDADRIRHNLVLGAGVSIPLGRTARDRANAGGPNELYQWGLSGASFAVEPFAGRMYFDDATGLANQDLVGARGGLDFGRFVGLRGFYWRGVNDNFNAVQPIDSWGGEAQFRLNSGPGLTPFLLAGAAQLNFRDSFAGPGNAVPDDQTSLILGGGLSFGLTERFSVNAAARNYLFSQGDLDDVSQPDDLVHNWMLSAGLRVSVGGTSAAGASRDLAARQAERDRELRELRAALAERDDPDRRDDMDRDTRDRDMRDRDARDRDMRDRDMRDRDMRDRDMRSRDRDDADARTMREEREIQMLRDSLERTRMTPEQREIRRLRDSLAMTRDQREIRRLRDSLDGARGQSGEQSELRMLRDSLDGTMMREGRLAEPDERLMRTYPSARNVTIPVPAEGEFYVRYGPGSGTPSTGARSGDGIPAGDLREMIRQLLREEMSRIAPSQPYGPMQPQYAPMQPQYAPMQPQYAPMQPQYAPMQPQYAPMQPQYAPAPQPQYVPGQPQPRPTPMPRQQQQQQPAPMPPQQQQPAPQQQVISVPGQQPPLVVPVQKGMTQWQVDSLVRLHTSQMRDSITRAVRSETEREQANLDSLIDTRVREEIQRRNAAAPQPVYIEPPEQVVLIERRQPSPVNWQPRQIFAYSGVGSGIQGLLGARVDLGPVSRGFPAVHFFPEVALGFGGGGRSTMVTGNLQYEFPRLSFGDFPPFRPHVNAGLGILNFADRVAGRDGVEAAVNVGYGVAVTLWDRVERESPVLFVEHQGVDLFSLNRLLLGLRWGL